MRYKLDSIRRVMKIANELLRQYRNKDINDIKLCISKGNRKIGRVMNISMMPILTCHNCKECSNYCYDIKACLRYPNTVIDARIRNTILAQNNPKKYFSAIDDAMNRRRKEKYFRWHVAGDILNINYLKNMIKLAKKHPDFVTWTYTKNYAVVNRYCKLYGKHSIPANLIIMFSEWDGMPMENPYHFPIFTCKLENGNKNHPNSDYFDTLYKCPGNCDLCKKKKLGCIGGMDTYCDEH